jgi:hypothetical protein
MSTARYTVKALKFDCIDESGIDWTGSDEPCWTFTSRDNAGNVRTTHSREFGSVDSGDTYFFKSGEHESIVWPRKEAVSGSTGPIALSIQLWEIDQGKPADIAAKTRTVLELAEQAPVIGEWVRRVPSVVRDQLNNLIADDLMGSRTLLFPESYLARSLTRVGQHFDLKRRFGGNSGDLPFEVAGGPDYDLYLRVKRVA